MTPPDGIAPISPYAPGKPVAPHQQPSKDREQYRDDGSDQQDKEPVDKSVPPPNSEKEKPENSGPGVDRYA